MPWHLQSFELQDLRCFFAAAEFGSLRKAAASLNTHESAVSRRIRNLENRLGASLFQRYNGGVSLTFAGKQFLKHVRSAVKHLGNGIRDVRAIGRSEVGNIRIGIFSSAGSGFLYDLFQSYSLEQAGVQIQFDDEHPTEQIMAVRMQELDIAFVPGAETHAECETTPLWSEQIFAALPTAHPLATRKFLCWLDLKAETFVVSERAAGHDCYDYLAARLNAIGGHPLVRRQNVLYANLISLVAFGQGVALTTQTTTSAHFPGVVYVPINGENLLFSAVWSLGNDNPALCRLLSLARVKRQVATI